MYKSLRTTWNVELEAQETKTQWTDLFKNVSEIITTTIWIKCNFNDFGVKIR